MTVDEIREKPSGRQCMTFKRGKQFDFILSVKRKHNILNMTVIWYNDI